VKGRELLHPSDVRVYVSVTAPAAIALTTPALVTVAMSGLLLVQVPLTDGVTLLTTLSQLALEPPRTGAPGIVSITTLDDVGDIQLFVLVTVNV
jgi:hypothetical protein